MAIDIAKLEKLRQQMDSLTSKGTSTFQKKDWDEIQKKFWKPKAGKNVIRIVPYQFNSVTPFTSVYFYFGLGKGRLMSLKTFEELDPIHEYGLKLQNVDPETMKRGEKVPKDQWIRSQKFMPKLRVFAPVIVRGEEHLGVRFWEFGEKMYKKLLALYLDEDYGDIDDIKEGHDITVTFRTGAEVGNEFGDSDILPKPKSSVATESKEVAEMIMNKQPNLLEDLFIKPTRDYLTKKLETYLENLDEEEDSTEVTEKETSSELDEETESKLNNLFGEDESTDSIIPEKESFEEDYDDLFN